MPDYPDNVIAENRLALQEAVRTLLLPIDSEREEACLMAVREVLTVMGVTSLDQAVWLRLELERWRDSLSPSVAFTRVAKVALNMGCGEFGLALSKKYFDLHRRLIQIYLLPFDQALAFLSHTLLILRLAHLERMSAAQIAKLLAARDERLTFRWRAVQAILSQFKLSAKLISNEVASLYAADSSLEEELFADASIPESSALVSEVGRRLGYPYDIDELLSILVTPDATTFGPYLQMLHYQCVIAEFYDHAVTNAYEFGPRGLVATWLFDQYPDALIEAGNPFLNNAKAVQQLDFAWAEGREDHLGEARAIATLLRGLESMSFAARRELAGWLRRWLHRIMRYHQPLAFRLPEAPNSEQARFLLERVRTRITNTRGIVEQRVLDALTWLNYRGQIEWRSRGLGDSVNATNISSRKLGDIDFQNAREFKVEAYEAHAGVLSAVYVDEHRRTLEKTLRLRTVELSGIAEIDQWEVKVTFVAHDVVTAEYPDEVIAGVRVRWEFVTFREFVAEKLATVGDVDLVLAFQEHIHDPLNQLRTPNHVREQYCMLAGLTVAADAGALV